jgi:polysaccharide biosynthesis protein PslG
MRTQLRVRILGGIAALAALVALGAPAPATASASSAPGPGMFGISPGGDIQDSARLRRDLDTLERAGARWLRVDINWAQIQRGGRNSYDWEAIDRVVRGARDRGMRVLGTIVYTPAWARPSGTSATYGPDPATYALFARRAVRHYSAMGVHAYEVWNEPNVSAFWTPAPNAAAYTRLLQAAYPAMKAADPGATVLTGGTAPALTDTPSGGLLDWLRPGNGTGVGPVEWLGQIYANGGRGFFDGVAHHPYCWPAMPGQVEAWSAWHQMYGSDPSLRSLMADNGDGAKAIWATEFGVPTDGPSGTHVSESVQASMVAKAYRVWRGYGWGGPLFTFSGRDRGTNRSTNQNFFGLVRRDFSRKPAFGAYRKAAARAAARRAARP